MVWSYVCQEMEGNAQRFPAGWRDVFELRVSHRWHKRPCRMAVVLTAFGSGKVRRGIAGIPRSEHAHSAGCASLHVAMASLVRFAPFFCVADLPTDMGRTKGVGESLWSLHLHQPMTTTIISDSSSTTPLPSSSRFPAQPSHSR